MNRKELDKVINSINEQMKSDKLLLPQLEKNALSKVRSQKLKKFYEIQLELNRSTVKLFHEIRNILTPLAKSKLKEVKYITKINRLGIKYDKHIESFGGIKDYSLKQAMSKMILLNLDKRSSVQYEKIFKQQIELTNKIAKEFRKLKSDATQLKSLSESDEFLLEGKITNTFKSAFKSFKKGINKIFMGLVEGWIYVLKSLSPIAKSITSKIDYISDKFKGKLAKGITLIISKVSPGFGEDLNIIPKSELEDLIMSVVKKGAGVVLGFIGLPTLGAITTGISVFKSVLDRVQTAGEIANVADNILDLVSIGENLDLDIDI